MKLVVFGATGGTGRNVVKQALEADHEVSAFALKPPALTISHEKLDGPRGDVMDPDSIRSAMVGKDTAISALGVGFSREPTAVYSAGVSNILRAMESAGWGDLSGSPRAASWTIPTTRFCSGTSSSLSSKAFSDTLTRTWPLWRR